MAAAAAIGLGGCGRCVAGGIACLQGLAHSGQNTHRQSKWVVNSFLFCVCVWILRSVRHAEGHGVVCWSKLMVSYNVA